MADSVVTGHLGGGLDHLVFIGVTEASTAVQGFRVADEFGSSLTAFLSL